MAQIAKSINICLTTLLSIPKERKYNIISVKPSYRIVDKLNEFSIVVDLGTGENADFSLGLIRKYGLNAYGFDPTRKHHPSLDGLVEKTRGHFRYYKYAISAESGTKQFFESIENRSGTFFSDHVNVRNDKTLAYDVTAVRLDAVFDMVKIDKIDVLKMDIEGEEYSVLTTVSGAKLRAIDQIVVEFHHDTVDRFSIEDTNEVVRILENNGFKWHTTDDVNYLFFRDEQQLS